VLRPVEPRWQEVEEAPLPVGTCLGWLCTCPGWLCTSPACKEAGCLSSWLAPLLHALRLTDLPAEPCN